LIDTHKDCRAEFRAEKIDSSVLPQFDTLGLGDLARSAMTRIDEVSIVRFDRLYSHVRNTEYSFRYANLVNCFRAALPQEVDFEIGSVSEIVTSDRLQRIKLSDERVIEGRLLIMATGSAGVIRSKMNMDHEILSRSHSLSIGFSLKVPRQQFPFESLAYYGNGIKDRIAYLSVFPIGDLMRGNLFTYHDAASDWAKAFRLSPEEKMKEAMPGLAAICGDLEVDGPLNIRSTDLYRVSGYKRDGVVLIGDAFETCCPVIGKGICKVMTDVDVLCRNHIPQWLAASAIGRDQVTSFYDDVRKRECDRQALEMSLYARSIGSDTGFTWASRRFRNVAVRRSVLALKDTQNLIKGALAFGQDRAASAHPSRRAG